jgi:hypothetical protein
MEGDICPQQIYAGPLLSYGLGSFAICAAGRSGWSACNSTGMLVFTATTMIISFIHIGLFSFSEIADLLWFGWFILASLILAVLSFRALQPGA